MSATARYAVRLSAGAEADLDEIVQYVAENDSPLKAAHLLDRILDVVASLATAPHRGAWPRELLDLGIHDYRQTTFKPYRLIYTVVETPRREVFIVLIADGRRNMRALLERRLLRPPAPPTPGSEPA